MNAFVATPEDAGERLDVVVARRAGISRAVAARLIASGDVAVDGAPASKSHTVEAGARVTVSLPAAEPDAAPQPEDIPFGIAFEDEHLLVVSKPAGLVVHPGAGHRDGTLVNALLARTTPAGGGAERPGIVHRLDAGTSGLILVAKSPAVYERLSEMMAAREVARTYLALVEGSPQTDTATIDAPIGRSPRHRKKMAVVAGGREAVTDYTVTERHAATALLEVRLRTGRTHQIRVHLAEVGTPVAGDTVYGADRKLARALGLSRPFLHAAGLAFRHPVSTEAVELADPLPADLEGALARARA